MRKSKYHTEVNYDPVKMVHTILVRDESTGKVATKEITQLDLNDLFAKQLSKKISACRRQLKEESK